MTLIREVEIQTLSSGERVLVVCAKFISPFSGQLMIVSSRSAETLWSSIAEKVQVDRQRWEALGRRAGEVQERCSDGTTTEDDVANSIR